MGGLVDRPPTTTRNRRRFTMPKGIRPKKQRERSLARPDAPPGGDPANALPDEASRVWPPPGAPSHPDTRMPGHGVGLEFDRPRGIPRIEWIKALAAEIEPSSRKTYAELYARRLARIALTGTDRAAIDALSIIFDRLEPKPMGPAVQINNVSAEFFELLQRARARLVGDVGPEVTSTPGDGGS